MIHKKEVYEIKHADTGSDKIYVLAEIHVVKDNRIAVHWKKDYGTPDFSVEEFESLSSGLREISKEKFRHALESQADPDIDT